MHTILIRERNDFRLLNNIEILMTRIEREEDNNNENENNNNENNNSGNGNE